MNDNKQFARLVTDTKKKIVEFGITSKSVIGFFDRCTRLLTDYLISSDQSFSLEVGFSWLEQHKFDDSCSVRSNYILRLSYRRTILLLSDNQNNQLIHWKVYPLIKQVLPQLPAFIHELSEYKSYLKISNYADATIDFRMRCAKEFLVFLETSHLCSLDQLTNQLVADYFASDRFSNRKPSGVQAEAGRVKLFLEYLEDEGIVANKQLHYAVPRYRLSEMNVITTITPLAKKHLLSDYPNLRSNKREKAMCLFALHLGLRTRDIQQLRFKDIDWDTGNLSIVQHKTGVAVKMTIDNETQNALIDYLLNERRTTDCDVIFITSKGPISPLRGSDRNIYKRIKGIDRQKNIPSQGLHILRRTFASDLLKSGAPLPVISTALGHLDKEEVHHYLSTDELNMKRCALDLTLIPFARSGY